MTLSKIFLVGSLALTMTSGCESSKRTGNDLIFEDVVWVYSDANANRYLLSSTTVEYSNTITEQSSSGLYSGGEPWKTHIGPEQWKEIKKLIAMAKAKSAENGQRTKGSGVLFLGEERWILPSGSPEQYALDEYLLSLSPGSVFEKQ